MDGEWQQWGWRNLFLELRDHPADDGAEAVVFPFVEQHAALIEELHEIGRPESHTVRVEKDCDYPFLWGLYALSRMVDVLISPFQPVNDDPDILNWVPQPPRPWWEGRIPEPDTYARFMAALRCTRIGEERFHPFFHEIVAVEAADDPDKQPELVDEVWPGYLVGSMLLARAGVTVRAGRNVLDPDLASRSPLFWAWWRRSRKPVDMSHGWGHNSQWGTDFRRDYVVGDELHYNVDRRGKPPPDRDDPLPPDQALALLRYRCSTTVDLGADQWPFDDDLVERRR